MKLLNVATQFLCSLMILVAACDVAMHGEMPAARFQGTVLVALLYLIGLGLTGSEA